MDGEGELVNDKGTYRGQMKKDKREGRGVFVFRDKRKYEGSFVADMFEGSGKLTEVTGKQYEGEFKNNKQHGRFKVTDPSLNNAVSYEDFFEGKKILPDSSRV